MPSLKYKKDGEWKRVGVGVGVTSFNSRYGNVEPQAGDYTAEQVGADPSGSADAALSQAKAYVDEQIGNIESSASGESNVYTSLEDIGLTTGSETLVDIATSLPENSILILNVGDNNNSSVYPTTYGVLHVIKAGVGCVAFDMFKKNSYTRYFAGYNSETGAMTGWVTSASTSSTTKSASSVTLQNTNQLRFAKPSEDTEVQVAGAWNDGTNSSRITGYRFLDGNNTLVPIYASELYEGAEKLSTKYAPAYTYGTDDIEAGSASPYETGHLHLVIE